MLIFSHHTPLSFYAIIDIVIYYVFWRYSYVRTKAISIGGMPYDKSAIIYFDQKITPKACILYFHGGGLLYGHKDDLPDGHLRLLTQAGYRIISFDYPLAPAAKLPLILDDVRSSIHHSWIIRKLTAQTPFPIFSGDALPGPICV